MLHRSRFLLHCSVLTCLLSSLLSSQQSSQLGKIIGNIRVSRGDVPPQRVLVSLEMRGTPVQSVYSDDRGQFGFYSLVANEYRVTVTDESYEPYAETVRVDPSTSPMNFVQMSLVPKATVEKDPLTGRVGGSNPYLVDPAEYLSHVPKRARKEFDKGREAGQEGNTDEAVRHYLRALEYWPDFYQAHNNLGTIYLSRRNFEAAQIEFQSALKSNQNDSQAYFNLANLFLLTSRYDDAERQIQEGLKRRPDSAFGKFLQGSLYTHTNRLEMAEKSLQSALQLDPKMSEAYLQLVNLYLQQRRVADAVTQLEAYLKTFPDSALAAKARDLLKRLQAEPAAPSK